ncbi:MAG: hypothetical protein WBA72_07270 [Ornithinimicrobium sp.]
MSATNADRVSPGPQWLVVSRLLATEGMRALLSATVVMAGFALCFFLVARSQGWGFAEASDDMLFGVVADQRSVVFVVTSGWLPIAIGTAAIIVSIVLTATRTRLLISVGLTRHAITVGTAVMAVTLVSYAVLVGGIVTLFLGPSALAGYLGADGADVTNLLVTGTSSLVLGVVAAIVVTVLFLRWSWWVGVLVLMAFGLTRLAILLSGVAGVFDTRAWTEVPWGLWLFTAALGVAYWAMMRRLPVR